MGNSCENCKYILENEHGEHCSNCVHNAKDNFEPLTNADRIRNMTVEELAELLCRYEACGMCPYNSDSMCFAKNCDEIGITEKWLQSPVEV